MPRPYLPAISVLAASALALAACSTPTDSPSPAGTSTVTSTAAPASFAPADAAKGSTSASPAPSTSRVSNNGSDSADQSSIPANTNDGLAMLGTPGQEDLEHWPPEPVELSPVAVRAGAHDGFDRVVIEFDANGEPGWFTQLTDNPTQLASGNPLRFEGQTALVITIEGTPAPMTPELADKWAEFKTYPGAGQVREVQFVSAFEAQSQFLIGLDGPRDYSVTYLSDPGRVVIDIAHA